MFVCLCVCLCVCQFISSLPHLVRFGQLLRCAHKRIVNRNKVYIERNNLLVELIRFYKNITFIHVYFGEARNSCNIAHRTQLKTVAVRQCLLGGRTCPTLFTVQLNGELACFFLLLCSPNYAIRLIHEFSITGSITRQPLLMADQACNCWFFFITNKLNGLIFNMEYDILYNLISE